MPVKLGEKNERKKGRKGRERERGRDEDVRSTIKGMGKKERELGRW